MSLNKINFSRDFVQMNNDINQIIQEEQYFYAASRVLYNNNQQILREIEEKKKIKANKMVYSKGKN
jgi:hypothetical protein